MKRFVDVSEAIGDGLPRFAFYCTIVDRFEEFSGEMTWESWDDFARGYDGDELDRYRRLCPEWAFSTK